MNLDATSAPSDFYATMYALASLDFLMSSDFPVRYKLDIDEFGIDQLLHEGLAEICALPPNKLGYDGSLPQALRANGALLFFLAPLLFRLRAQYLNASIQFLGEHAKMLDDEISWLNDDFGATVDILAGLNAAQFALGKREVELTQKAWNFVSRQFYKKKSRHPATLGFMLCIYSTSSISKSSKPSIQEDVIDNLTDKRRAKILFLAADPTDASRLRLGEELREIQEKLQLAKQREQFELHQRMSVRPADISQALLDVQPRTVHFSGHGITTGALCFENQVGQTHPIQPDALAALFEQFANQVNCVVLNACYSENQANAIAKHIDYVIGMNQAIGDEAAIAFAVGFYQALGAGRTIEEAYKLGCVQIRLQGIPEHLTPVLVKKGTIQS